MTLQLTNEEIDAQKTDAGGWTRETLAKWGVPFPPPRGWRKALVRGYPIPTTRAAKAEKTARKAKAKKARKKPDLPPVVCIECGRWASMVSGAEIYPHRPDLHGKRFWLCVCGAYVGTHHGRGAPLGSPAGPVTRRARNEAHAAFDPLWAEKSRRDNLPKREARERAYAWLAGLMGLTRETCHIGMMNAEQARRVAWLCRGGWREVTPSVDATQIPSSPNPETSSGPPPLS